jgi:hypothetical protein
MSTPQQLTMNAPPDTTVPHPFVINHSSLAAPCPSLSIRGVILLISTLAPALLAQPAPKLTSVSPEWIQRGTTVEVVLAGENLGGVTQILFNGDAGLSATNMPAAPPPAKPTVTVESTGGGITRAEPTTPPREEKRIVVKVTAATDAALGTRELRVVAPGGVSNPLNFNTGQWPEIGEKEINTSTPQGQLVELPAAISGVISAAAQSDAYRFKAAKGQEVIFEVDASRRGSPLDSSLVVLDAKGKELARNEDALGLDSLLFFTAPEEGDYVVTLRDFRYQGGGNYAYRLYAGPLPYVESVFPFGGQRGKSVEVAIAGRNLEGTSKLTLAIDANAPRTQEIRVKTPRGYSNLIPFNVSDLPDAAEAEPNDALTNAQSVTLSLVINGRIGAAKDVDRFRFKSDKDQKIACDVAASRFGSSLDALLILTDTNGAVIAQNDDAAGADARIEFDAKKDTEYVIALRDLTERGGERFGYRLTLRPPAGAGGPSFNALFLPDTIRIHRAGLMKVRCEVTRAGGFDGPVHFEVEGLPSGVAAEPLLIPGSATSGILLLDAAKDAPPGSTPIRVTATGTIGGKPVSVGASPLSGDKAVKQGFLTVLEAVPFSLELLTLSLNLEQNQSGTVEVFAQRREGFSGEIKLTTEGFAMGREAISKNFEGGEAAIKANETTGKLTLKPKLDSEVGARTIVVRGDAGGAAQYSRPIPVTVTQYPLVLSSTLGKLSVTALPTNSASAAGEAETKIKVDRRAGFNSEVELAIEGLPAGIKSDLGKLAASAGETTLKITATEKAPITNATFTVVGTATFNDRNYKTRTGPITLVISAPEPVEIVTNAPPAAPTPPTATK